MARISELHYSNAYAAQTGVNEFLEVALQPGQDPADFVVSFYQANGTLGVEFALTDPRITSSVDPDNGEIVYVLSADNLPILLTDPDGGGATNYEAYALTNVATSTLIDFYDIGGGTTAITVTTGAAAAAGGGTATSVNIPTPTGPNSIGASIQFNQPDPNNFVFTTVSPGDTGLVCFATGAEILTDAGFVAVEALTPGDLVVTRDNGLQPVQWCGARMVSGIGPFAPVTFSAGSYGATKDLRVSAQHRVLVTGQKANLLFGEDEVLVPAKALIDDKAVRQIPCHSVTFHHILFDHHQIIQSHGFWSESYYPVAFRAAGWSDPVQEELEALFPELADGSYGALARPSIPVQLGKLLRQS